MGLPKADMVTSYEVREALEPIIRRIEDMVKSRPGADPT